MATEIPVTREEVEAILAGQANPVSNTGIEEALSRRARRLAGPTPAEAPAGQGPAADGMAADAGSPGPATLSMEVPIDKFAEIIGPEGTVIQTLQQETGATISLGTEGAVGTVTVEAATPDAATEALRRIDLILEPPSPRVGDVYEGRVVNLTKVGALVKGLPGHVGILPVSKLALLTGGKPLTQVGDVLAVGQSLRVRVDDIEPDGKVSLGLVGAETPGTWGVQTPGPTAYARVGLQPAANGVVAEVDASAGTPDAASAVHHRRFWQRP